MHGQQNVKKSLKNVLCPNIVLQNIHTDQDKRFLKTWVFYLCTFGGGEGVSVCHNSQITQFYRLGLLLRDWYVFKFLRFHHDSRLYWWLNLMFLHYVVYLVSPAFRRNFIMFFFCDWISLRCGLSAALSFEMSENTKYTPCCKNLKVSIILIKLTLYEMVTGPSLVVVNIYKIPSLSWSSIIHSTTPYDLICTLL